MKLVPSTEQDIEQLTKWIEADPYHKDCLNPRWWLTGNALLSYRLEDSAGTTMYVRTEPDGDALRIHTQFAPESEVSKSRTVKSIIWAIPRMEVFAEMNDLHALVYKSVSPALIQFMEKKFRFVSIGNDDYRMPI